MRLIEKEGQGRNFVRLCVKLLLIFDVILCLLHQLFPHYQWGQGRSSYFTLSSAMTLSSWFISMQLIGISIFSLLTLLKRWDWGRRGTFQWVWFLLVSAALSVAEFTRFHIKMNFLNPLDSNIFHSIGVYLLGGMFLGVSGTLIWMTPGASLRTKILSFGWLLSWLGAGLLTLGSAWAPADWMGAVAYLFGTTLWLAVASELYFQEPSQEHRADNAKEAPPVSIGSTWLLLGVAGSSFTMIFLQVLHFQILTVAVDTLAAHSVLPLALIGIAVGGILGLRISRMDSAGQLSVGLAALLPISICASFAVASNEPSHLALGLALLFIPFMICGALITLGLVWLQPSVVYCVDLLGAALGAFCLPFCLAYFQEEGSLWFLAAIACLVAVCFAKAYRMFGRRFSVIPYLALAGFMAFTAMAYTQKQGQGLNIVAPKIQASFPGSEIIFSKSSFVGRVDLVRRSRKSDLLKAYENGFTIDTIRKNIPEQYQIDPRIPSRLATNPKILILGLAGDGVTKTAKQLSNSVTGVEINPAMVALQKSEASEFNANSYQGIDVKVMDARSFLQTSSEQYDVLTLLNAHTARGRAHYSGVSAEYLHTKEAVREYWDHMTPRGFLSIEEPADRPSKEPGIWKFLVTMRGALLDAGAQNPENHFFVFQWKTKSNNYIQIILKKSPFTQEQISDLKKWLDEIDRLREIEKIQQRRLGPIDCKTTLLYSPGENVQTTYANLIRGTANPQLHKQRNLVPATDDRPFLFNTDPRQGALYSVYLRTLLLVLLLGAWLIGLMRKQNAKSFEVLSVLCMASLTGVGYLLVELVLMQRYQIFLGSPVTVFCVVLGSMLVFSGLGSLWGARHGLRAMVFSIIGVVVNLWMHQQFAPIFLDKFSNQALIIKCFITIASLAPLSFFMGVPFPYLIQNIKERLNASFAGAAVAANAGASALGVPLALMLSMKLGFNGAFACAMLIYGAVAVSFFWMNRNRFAIAGFFSLTILAVTLASPTLINLCSGDLKDKNNGYQVYGIRYGRSLMAERQLIRGGDKNKKVSLDWRFWLVQGSGKNILVDTGFENPSLARQKHFSKYVRPSKKLSDLGIEPSEITDVILTHAHWDHAGGVRMYPNAVIWMQSREWEHMLQLKVSNQKKVKGMRYKDFEALEQAYEQGRLRLLSGDADVASGIRVELGGGHTPGSQAVIVKGLEGNFIIAGDTTYLYRNSQWHQPIGGGADSEENLRMIRRFHADSASPYYILPGHDPLIGRCFPEVAKGIVEITSAAERR